MNGIKKTVNQFVAQLEKDPHHRYKSWEHCFSTFQHASEQDIDFLCLHLGFYLASWGMYRGSSFLLSKDYLIHRKAVKEIVDNIELLNIDMTKITNPVKEQIIHLHNRIKDSYNCVNIKNSGSDSDIRVTDTLSTKILLGTVGCIPAYDRFFIKGMRSKGIKYSSVNLKNIQSLIDYYQDHQEVFDSLQKKISEKRKIVYPIMKILDMHFWQIGFNN